jgi:hypothetical protein
VAHGVRAPRAAPLVLRRVVLNELSSLLKGFWWAFASLCLYLSTSRAWKLILQNFRLVSTAKPCSIYSISCFVFCMPYVHALCVHCLVSNQHCEILHWMTSITIRMSCWMDISLRWNQPQVVISISNTILWLVSFGFVWLEASHMHLCLYWWPCFLNNARPWKDHEHDYSNELLLPKPWFAGQEMPWYWTQSICTLLRKLPVLHELNTFELNHVQLWSKIKTFEENTPQNKNSHWWPYKTTVYSVRCDKSRGRTK